MVKDWLRAEEIEHMLEECKDTLHHTSFLSGYGFEVQSDDTVKVTYKSIPVVQEEKEIQVVLTLLLEPLVDGINVAYSVTFEGGKEWEEQLAYVPKGDMHIRCVEDLDDETLETFLTSLRKEYKKLLKTSFKVKYTEKALQQSKNLSQNVYESLNSLMADKEIKGFYTSLTPEGLCIAYKKD